jgi:hypothetical protein
MLPSEWLQYIAKKEAEIKQRPADAPKKPQVQKGRMMSARQRIASSQQRNTVKAMYQPESEWNATPVRPDTKGLTLNVGGTCEPDPPHGKATQSRS